MPETGHTELEQLTAERDRYKEMVSALAEQVRALEGKTAVAKAIEAHRDALETYVGMMDKRIECFLDETRSEISTLNDDIRRLRRDIGGSKK